jgi:hypothetical protein
MRELKKGKNPLDNPTRQRIVSISKKAYAELIGREETK